MSIVSKIETMRDHVSDIYDTLTIAGSDLTNVNKNIVNINNNLKERLKYYLGNGIDIVWENWEKIDISDTSFTLNNTIKGKMEIKIKPSELYQETTTGKQLFNKNAEVKGTGHCTYTYSNGVYTLTNSDTSNFSIDIEAIIPAGSYILNSETSLSATTQIRDNSSTLHNFGNNYSNQSFTISSASTVIRFNFVSSTTPVKLDLNTLMISISGGDYEPYTNGASPNPDYPQEIHTISGNNEIKIVNKNLQSGEQLYQKMYSFDSSHVSERIDGNVNAIQFNPRYYRPILGFNFIEKWKENTQYTIRCLVKNLNGSVIFISAIYTDGTTDGARIEGSTTEYTELRYVTENNKTIQNLGFSFGTAGSWLIDKSSWFIGEGDTTDYVPHQEQSLPLNLGDLEYCKIGDYEDEFFKNSGKNLFDKDSATYKNNYYINSDGVETSTNASGYTTSYIEVKPNTVYTINGKIKTTITSSAIYFYDNNKNWTSRATNESSKSIGLFTFTTPNNCYYIRIQYIMAAYDASTIMLNEGSTSLPYEPYGTDEWYLKKNIGKVVLDGSETSWDMGTGTNVFMNTNIFNNTYLVQNAYSNYFKNIVNENITGTGTANSNLQNNEFSFRWGTKDRIYIKTDIVSTVADFKNWLSTHNTIVYYVLATPTYILLNETLQEQLENIYYHTNSYNDQTNVSQINNDLSFIIKAKALIEL